MDWDKAIDQYWSAKDVTCGVCTKNRYDILPQTLQSIAAQTYKPSHLIIVDDSDEPKDLRTLPVYQNLFQLFNELKIGWEVVWGRKLGQHHSHQMIQEKAATKFIWRLDDDEVAEPDVLEKLLSRITDEVGAVGGLVLVPPAQHRPGYAASVITDLNRPNIQWFRTDTATIEEVDHLTSTFLYRKGIAEFERFLSPAAHREETLFTYEIKRKGYKLLVDPTAITWHFRAGHGGIRSHQDARYWEEDEKLFQERLRNWGVVGEQSKIIVLDCGKGDEIIVKSLIPDLKKKYGKLIIACCSPDLFEGEEVDLISIADAQARLGNLDCYNIYRACIDWGWKDSLENAFRKMYEI